MSLVTYFISKRTSWMTAPPFAMNRMSRVLGLKSMLIYSKTPFWPVCLSGLTVIILALSLQSFSQLSPPPSTLSIFSPISDFLKEGLGLSSGLSLVGTVTPSPSSMIVSFRLSLLVNWRLRVEPLTPPSDLTMTAAFLYSMAVIISSMLLSTSSISWELMQTTIFSASFTIFMATYLIAEEMCTVTAEEYSQNFIFQSCFSKRLQMSEASVFSGRIRMNFRAKAARVPRGRIQNTDQIVGQKWMNSSRIIHFMHKFYRMSGSLDFSLLSWKIERQVSITQPAILSQQRTVREGARQVLVQSHSIKKIIHTVRFVFKINTLKMKSRKVLTLLIIHQENRLLLGMKKRGFGVGRYNGFGGKVQKDETIMDAAIRQTIQQAGVRPTDTKHLGIIDFEFKGDPVLLEVHLFKATTFTGEVKQSEQMKPEWFDTDKVPFEKMWPDDVHWFPYMLAGKPFKAYFLFEGHDKILEQKIEDSQ